MNAKQRARLKEVVAILEEIKEEESAKFDNLPEGLQQAEQGQQIESAKDNLEEAIGYVETAIDGE